MSAASRPTSKTGRGNRFGLGLIGVILIVGGAAVIGQTQGVVDRIFTTTSTHDPLLSSTEVDFAHQHGWFWPVAAVAAGIVALLCLRWLIVQLRRDRPSTYQLEPDRSTGATRLPTAVLAQAVAEEIETFASVRRARLDLDGRADRPAAHVSVVMEDRAQFGPVRHRIETEALPHLRDALGVERVPVRITFRVA